MKPFVIGIGEILWDMLPQGKQLGGAPTNFAYYAKAHEAETLVVSCVGNDPLGDEVVGVLDGLSITTAGIARHDTLPTGTVSVELSPEGHPTYTINPGVAWDAIPCSDALVDAGFIADAVCFGSLAQRSAESRATIRALLKAVPERALRVFDVNLRCGFYDREVLEESLALSNVLKLNDDELPIVCDLLEIAGDESERLRQLVERYRLRIVALTKGAAGSLIMADGKTSEHPGVPTAVADTVGAGDAFTATMAMGLLRGYDLDRLHARASEVASYICSRPGATHPLPPNLVIA